MDAFAAIAERRILEAMERGDFDDLPGHGRPIEFEDDAFVPEDMRMALKICRNAGCLPPELETRQEIIRLGDLVRTLESGAEKDLKVKELNLKLLRFNITAKRPLNLDLFPEYEDRALARLTARK